MLSPFCSGSFRKVSFAALVVLSAALCLNAESVRGSQSARALVTQPVNDGLVTSIRSESFRLPKGAADLGPVDAAKELDLWLDLRRSPEQQQALDSFVARTRKPGDAMYGKTLTAAEFAESFGISSKDMAAIQLWLERRGFSVTEESAAHMTVEFHGTAAQAEEAFGTELHRYEDDGHSFFASTPKLLIPTALAPVIRNVGGLQDFRREPIASFDGPVQASSAIHGKGGEGSAHDLNPGWTTFTAGQVTHDGVKPHPEAGTATTTAVTLNPTAVSFASGTAVAISTVVKWTGTATPTGTVTVSDTNQTLSASIALSSCTAGTRKYTCTYNWTNASGAGFTSPETLTAAYGGDANFAASSGSADLTVNYASGTLPVKRATSLTVTPNTVVQGATTAQTISALVKGNASGGVPTGSIEIWGPGTIGLIAEFPVISGSGVSTGCATSGSAGRIVTCTYSWNPPATLLPGSYQLEFSYSGTDSTYSAYQVVETTSFTVTASGATATTTAVTANPTHVGAASPGTTFTTVTSWTGTGSAPTGSVALTGPTGTDGGGPLGGAVFPAAGSTTSSGSGAYDFGDETYTYSCTTSTANKTVTCTIVDSDVYDVLPRAGANTVTADYSGSSTYAGSSGTVKVTLDADDTSLTVSASPATSVAGTTPSITYTVLINDLDDVGTQPAGAVTLSGSVISGSPLTKNANTCTYSSTTFVDTCTFTAAVPAALAAGSYTVTATYAGNATFAGSTGTLTFNVTGSTATSMSVSANPVTVSPATPSTTVTAVLTYTGSGAAPTGTMTLACAADSAGSCSNLPGAVNLTSCTTSTANKTVTCNIPYALDSNDSDYGSYDLTVAYSGNSTYTTASGSASVLDSEAVASTTTISLNPTSSYHGTAATTTATVTVKGKLGDGHAAGTVTVSGSGGLGTLATITLPAATNSQCSVVAYVSTCTATLTIPAGTAANTYTITAAYGGSATYASSSGTAMYTVKALDTTTTTASATPSTIAPTGSTSLKAVVADTTTPGSTPTGTVAFTEGATNLGSCTLTAGTCSVTASGATLGNGMDSVTATYTPSANPFGGSSGMTTVTVSSDTTTTTASATPSSITSTGSTSLKAVVADSTTPATTPTGTVAFTEGATNLGSCTLTAGTCSVTATGSTLGTGNDTVTATYTPSSGAFTGSFGTAMVSVGADLTFTSVSHNFGSVQAGTATSGTENYGVQLTNNSSSAVTGSVVISGGSGAFTQTNNCGTTLAAGAHCEIIFSFAPAAAQTYSATWSLTGQPGNATFSPSNGGTLTGTGVATAGVTLTTSKHNFGNQAVGTTSAVFGAVLTNSTSSAVTIAVAAPSGNTSSFITYLNNCGSSLAAGASCNLQYEFHPAATGGLSETIGITANGGSTTITAGGAATTGLTLVGNGQ